MIDSLQLAAFLAVIEEGAFDRAAARLSVTPSAVSQRIKLLEERLGQVLIRRTSPCAPTTAGETLLRFARQIQALGSEAMAELAASLAAPATITIAVNADTLATWFLQAIAPLARQHGWLFELLVDDQDHTAEMLRSGRVLAAVTSQPEPVQGCRVRSIGAMRYAAVASPDYFARYFARGISAAALARAPVITFNRKDMLQQRLMEKLVGKTLNPPTHWLPSSHAFNEAAQRAMGWGMVPLAMIGDEIETGKLRLLRRNATLDVPLYWQHWRMQTKLMDALTASVVQAAGGTKST